MLSSLRSRFSPFACWVFVAAVTAPNAAAMEPTGFRKSIEGRNPSYVKVLEQSTIVLIGRIQQSGIVVLKDEKGPPPKPIKDTTGMIETWVEPADYSWYREDLLNPPHVEAYQVKVAPKQYFRGDPQDEEPITVNLLYGTNRRSIESYWHAYLSSQSAAESACYFVLHLRAVAGEAESAQERVYEVVCPPWIIKPEKAEATSAGMVVRMNRYETLKQIDATVQKNVLSSQDIATIVEKIDTSSETLGFPVLNERERNVLESLKQSNAPPQVRSENWKRWWASERHGFIDWPFRVVAGSPTTQQTNNAEAGN